MMEYANERLRKVKKKLTKFSSIVCKRSFIEIPVVVVIDNAKININNGFLKKR